MRLIDADALLEQNKELADREIEHPKYQMTLREVVDWMPTIEQRDEAWEMFSLITSAWYGKECYFIENGIVYSRVSCRRMTREEALNEFLRRIADE